MKRQSRQKKDISVVYYRFVLTMSALAFAAGVGIAIVHRIGRALSDDDIRLLVGGCLVLAVLLITGALFVAWSASQNRLYRQMLEQDDYDEMRKMTMLFGMMRGKSPTVNIKTPENPQLQGPMVWPYPVVQQQGQNQLPYNAFDGEYRDTIDLE